MSDTDAPWIYLPLDELFPGGVLHDESGNRRNATIQGAFQVVDDATFGACLELAGGTFPLPEMRPGDFPRGLTIVAWVKVATAMATLCSFRQVGARIPGANFQVLYRDKTVVYATSLGGRRPSLGIFPVQPDDAASRAGWVLVVAALTPTGEVTGAGAVRWPIWGTDTPDAQTPASIITFGDPQTATAPQRMARLRVYDRVLDASEVNALRRGDVLGPAATDGLPVGFSFEDERASPALYIDPIGAGQAMTLRVTSAAAVPIRLAALSGPPSRTNCHFRLSFRRGTLASLDAASVVTPRWTIAAVQSDQEDALFLLFDGTPALPVDVAIVGLAGDAHQGTRVTRMELGYQHLRWNLDGAEVALEGTRSQQLSLISHAPAPPVVVKPVWQPFDIGQEGGRQWTAATDDVPRYLQEPTGLVHLRGRFSLDVPKVAIALGRAWPVVLPLPDTAAVPAREVRGPLRRLHAVPSCIALHDQTQLPFRTTDLSPYFGLAIARGATDPAFLIVEPGRLPFDDGDIGGTVRMEITLDGMSYWGQP